MAVSCREVMYGAYYPYLYPRQPARPFHHFQYDRFNVQGGCEGYGAGGVSTGSSSGAVSPASPLHPPAAPVPRLTKEEDLGPTSADAGGGSSESEAECSGGGAGSSGAGGGARAQYVSANCVVFTHYSGDVAAVVDEHFARALSQDKHKECVPMVSRNLPASFFNALAVAGVPPTGGGCSGVDLYDYDPWHQHYSQYGGRHAAAAAAAAAEYGGGAGAAYSQLLLQQRLHPQYKPVDWQHHLDPAYHTPYHASHHHHPHHHQYGLEAQVQDSSKDLYWF